MPNTEIPVEFGNISIGELTCRLGVKIVREELELDEADRIFCGRQIQGKVSLAPRGDGDQKRLPSMEDNRPLFIEGMFETKQIGVRPDEYSIGLTFNKKAIDVSELSQFAKKTGTIEVESVSDIPDPEQAELDKGVYNAGYEAGKGGAGVSRRCPYKKGDRLRDVWLNGFRDAEAEQPAEAE
jgi:ribosome modulation factor